MRALVPARWVVVLVLAVAVLLGAQRVEAHEGVDAAQLGNGVVQAVLIPHSHCDTAWLKTFDGYYEEWVHQILDNVLADLTANQRHTFIWSEISFFSRWFSALDGKAQAQLRALVDSGRFEFVGGGWVMSDEAVGHVASRINQMTLGHQYLLRHFGRSPRYGWMIDPFGASAVTPYLFAQMGFDALVHNRINYNDKDALMRTQHMDFLWNGITTMGEENRMLTHILDSHYCSPVGFSFEDKHTPQVTDANVAERARVLVETLRRRSWHYNTDLLLVPFGCDFEFRDAAKQFGNMDRLVDYVNAHTEHFNMTLTYGTLDTYFRALHAAKGATFPVLDNHDFFPYADTADAYWTGFYSSRPTLKRLSRELDAALRSAEMMFTLGAAVGERAGDFLETVRAHRNHNHVVTDKLDYLDVFGKLMYARMQAAIMNHHDAVTGTSKVVVNEDYIDRMVKGILASESVLATMTERLLAAGGAGSHGVDSSWLDVYDVGDVVHLEAGQLTPIVLFNSLGWRRKQFVRVLIPTHLHVRVENGEGQPTPFDVMPHFDLATGRVSAKAFALHFLATLPAAGVNTYFLRATEEPQESSDKAHLGHGGAVHQKAESEVMKGAFSIGHDHTRIHFDEHGMLVGIGHKDKLRRVQQQVMEYVTIRSGAYIFRPELGEAQPLGKHANSTHDGDGYPTTVFAVHGKHVSEVHQIWPQNVRQTFRVYNLDAQRAPITRAIATDEMVEIEYNVPHPGLNREIISRFRTNIATTHNEMYTGNGLNMMRRQFARRKLHDIAGNYEPMIGAALIRNSTMREQLTLLTRQSMGVGSVDSGCLEVMLHRRARDDDGRGLGEGMNVTMPANNTMWVLSDTHRQSEHVRVSLEVALNNPIHVMVGRTPVRSRKQWPHETVFFPMQSALPTNVHLLSLQRHNFTGHALLRLQHLYDKGADITQSRAVDVVVEQLLRRDAFSVKLVGEVSLTGVSDATMVHHRAQWPKSEENVEDDLDHKRRRHRAHASGGPTRTVHLDDTILVTPFHSKPVSHHSHGGGAGKSGGGKDDGDAPRKHQEQPHIADFSHPNSDGDTTKVVDMSHPSSDSDNDSGSGSGSGNNSGSGNDSDSVPTAAPLPTPGPTPAPAPTTNTTATDDDGDFPAFSPPPLPPVMELPLPTSAPFFAHPSPSVDPRSFHKPTPPPSPSPVPSPTPDVAPDLHAAENIEALRDTQRGIASDEVEVVGDDEVDLMRGDVVGAAMEMLQVRARGEAQSRKSKLALQPLHITTLLVDIVGALEDKA